MDSTRRGFLLLALAAGGSVAGWKAGTSFTGANAGHPAGTPASGPTTGGSWGGSPTGTATGGPAASGGTGPGATVTASPTGGGARSGTAPSGAPDGSRVLNVVAHPDDDLLFLSPDLLHSVRSGAQVRTVFLTAGDAGRGPDYWQGRFTGIRSAYAAMAGVADAWTPVDAGATGATAVALTAAPQVSLAFLKLPDGGAGHGFARYGHAALPQLWRGRQRTIRAVDGSGTYTRAGLLDTLTGMLRAFDADVVRTQDFLGRFDDGDHNDHHAAAYLTRTASRAWASPHRLVSYQDYATARRRANVTGPLLTAKRAAFSTYSHRDAEVFASRTGTGAYQGGFDSWLARQYVLTVE